MAEIKNKVTLSDIARQCGVGTPTVSRVLNNVTTGFSVKPAIRSKILSTARKLNYSPNMAAKNLRRQRTELIMIYGYDYEWTIYQDIYPAMLKAATLKLQEDNYDVNAAFSARNKRYRIPQMMDGALLLTNIYPELSLELRNKNIPYVILNDDAGEDESNVDVDDIQGTLLALDYLRQLGHRRILYWSAATDQIHSTHKSIQLRRKTYIEFMKNLNEEPLISESGQNDAEVVLSAVTQQKATAVLSYDIIMGVKLMNAANFAGIKIPEELSVIGFNRPKEALLPFNMSPSWVTAPSGKMGKAASEILLKKIENDKYNEHKLFDMVLHEADSTAPLSK